MIKRDKKGMLLASEVVKIVLSLIGIAILVYLLVALYFSKVDSENFAQAEATIQRISDVLERFDTNSSYVGNILDITPAKWTIFSFTGSNLKPNQCSGNDCLCICDKVWEDFGIYVAEDRQEKECSDNGACLNVENLKDFGEIYIDKISDGSTNLVIKRAGIWVEVSKG